MQLKTRTQTGALKPTEPTEASEATEATTQQAEPNTSAPAFANDNARKPRHRDGRLASISRDGRMAAFRRPTGVELCGLEENKRTLIGARIDASDGGNPDRLDTRGKGTAENPESNAPAVDFGFAPGGFWLLANQLVHWMTEDGRSLHETVVGSRRALRPSRGVLPSCILSGSDARVGSDPAPAAANTANSGANPELDIVELYDGQLFAFPLLLGSRSGESVFPIGPRLVCVANRKQIRLAHLERGTIFQTALPHGVIGHRRLTGIWWQGSRCSSRWPNSRSLAARCARDTSAHGSLPSPRPGRDRRAPAASLLSAPAGPCARLIFATRGESSGPRPHSLSTASTSAPTARTSSSPTVGQKPAAGTPATTPYSPSARCVSGMQRTIAPTNSSYTEAPSVVPARPNDPQKQHEIVRSQVCAVPST